MKKIFSLIVLGVFLFSLMGSAILADETSDSRDGSAIIVPNPDEEISDSGIFWDNINMQFNSNKEKKAEIALKISEKKAVQAAKHIESKKYEKAKKSAEKHKEMMEKAETYLEDVEEDGNADAVKKALAITIIFQNRIEFHKERALQIKERILEKHAEDMTNEQLSHLEEVFSRIEDRANISQEKIAQRQENLRARYKILTGMSDEEINVLMAEYDSFIKQQRELREQRMQVHEQKISGFKGKIKSSGNSVVEISENGVIVSSSGSGVKVNGDEVEISSGENKIISLN